MPLLEVKNLTTEFPVGDKFIRAVNSVSFSLKQGESLGIVGESGCGKSVMSLSLLRLIPFPGRSTASKILLNGKGGEIDILKLTDAQMQDVRGKRISLIFQDPSVSLDPVYTVGNQIEEAISTHLNLGGKARRDRALELLNMVGMPAPKERLKDYPNQLSGGMCQRVMIAMALACNPDVLIADEPTTSLDVTVQAQILELMLKLQKELGMSLIIITHDFGVVAEMVERVLVMYAGEFVEEGSVEEIFFSSRHPYTQALLKSILPLTKHGQRKPLVTIPGRVPDLGDLPAGCLFYSRCPKATNRCRIERVSDDPCGVGRLVRCFNV